MTIDVLVAREEVTVIRADHPAGEPIAGPHVHRRHADAFYVLEGELTFEVGRERRTITVTPGGFVAVPPGVAHAFRTSGDRPAR
jgi:quercetin dioxygenase-like cupin family protein